MNIAALKKIEDHQELNADIDELPTRSCIPSMVPEGKGTGQIESLTGYFVRMARKLMLDPITLFAVLMRTSPLQSRKVSYFYPANAMVVYFNQSLSGKWCENLAERIERENRGMEILKLSARPLTGVFHERGLVHRNKHWCPECMTDTAYDRLLWQLRAVTCCPLHHRLLEQECPACLRRQKNIHRNSSTIHCHYCGSSLADRASGSVLSQRSFEAWASRQCEKLIIEVQTTDIGPRTVVKGSIFRAMEIYGLGPIPLARLLGLSHNSVWYWIHRNGEVTLENALRFAWVFNISLVSLVKGTAEFDASKPLRNKKWPLVRRTYDRIDSQPGVSRDVLLAFERIRARNPLKMPLLSEIASEVGLRRLPRSLEQGVLRQKRDEFRQQLRLLRNDVRFWKETELIRHAVGDLIAEGRTVNMRTVGLLLETLGSSKGIFRQIHLRAYLDSLRDSMEIGDTSVLKERVPPEHIREILESQNSLSAAPVQ